MSGNERSPPSRDRGVFCCSIRFIVDSIICIAIYILGVLSLLVVGTFCAISNVQLVLLQNILWFFGQHLNVISGLDAVFWHVCRAWFADPMCQQVVTTALVVKGTPNVPKLRRLIRERLVDACDVLNGKKNYPRFKQHIAKKFGYFVWENDKEFTMDHRVVLWERGYTDETLMNLLQELYEKPFVKDHSPWEILLLPKVTGNNSTEEYIFLMRIFHSLGDGVQTLRICESLFERSSESSKSSSVTYYDDVLSGVPVNRMPVQFRHNPFLRYLRNPNAVRTSGENFEILINGLKTVFMAPWHLVEPLVQKKPSCSPPRLNAPVAVLTGRKLLAYTDRIDLQRFKEVTTVYKCTINDVYLHCLTGAYQRCNTLSVQKDPTDVQTYVKITTPINLLPKSGFWSENCFADLMMTLPSSGLDPASRLLQISKIGHAAKSSTAATGQLLLIHALGNHLPSFLAEFTFVDSLDLEIGATNLRGPDTDSTLCGDHVTDMFLAANNVGNAAVAFSFLSYNGGARIGVTVDKVVAPDDGIAQRIADNFVEELNNLVEMATVKNISTKH